MSRNLLGDFQRHLCSQLRTSSFAAAEPWNVRKVARFCLNPVSPANRLDLRVRLLVRVFHGGVRGRPADPQRRHLAALNSAKRRQAARSGKLWRTRSRLYRSQMKALAEIYKMHSFTQLYNNIFENFKFQRQTGEKAMHGIFRER